MPLVDSFLVRAGRVVAPAAHRDRMRESAHTLWGDEQSPQAIDDAVAALYDAAARRLEESAGLFFPKLTLAYANNQFNYSFDPRPIAESRLDTTAHLIAHPGSDERTHPCLKGPDFAWQERVRAWAFEHGASDALLRAAAPKGRNSSARQLHYSETTYGSVVLWTNGVLVTSSETNRLPSITERMIVEIARERGHETLAAPLTKQRLLEADAVWLLSSLHGVREATVGLTDLPAPHIADTYAPPRGPFAPAARDFQAALWERAEPIGELAA